jgi:hypothetical protein
MFHRLSPRLCRIVSDCKAHSVHRDSPNHFTKNFNREKDAAAAVDAAHAIRMPAPIVSLNPETHNRARRKK